MLNENNDGHSRPFGDPDGALIDISEVNRGFVEFPNHAIHGGLATERSDLRARVLYGRKGSGKTVYLRRLQDYARSKKDVFAFPVDRSSPPTEHIIRFCGFFQSNLLGEKWQLIWRHSVLGAIALHLIFNDHLKPYLSEWQRKNLLDEYGGILQASREVERSICGFLSTALGDHPNRTAMSRFLLDSRWLDLETRLSELMKKAPSMCFYIDSVDEKFKNAPKFWTKCQEGLFETVMALLREDRFSEKLHLTIGIRDVVISAKLRDEHATRMATDSRLRNLRWNRKSILLFLRSKLMTVPQEFFAKTKTRHPSVADWVGVQTITTDRGRPEAIEEYLFGHTRGIPRDVVILGNHVCEAVAKAKIEGKTRMATRKLRHVVDAAAKTFAVEQLHICASHLMSETTPAESVERGYYDSYTATSRFTQPEMVTSLTRMIEGVQTEIFKSDLVEPIEREFNRQYGGDIALFDVLWQNGVVGVVESSGRRPTAIYCAGDKPGGFTLPRDYSELILHATMMHVVQVKTVGTKPPRVIE